MSSKAKVPVPDAWDDDWESLADKKDSEDAQSASRNKPKISKAEKKAQHVEENKKLWKAAEEPPEPFIFLEAQDNVPLKSEFKSSVKVLSRKIKVASPSRSAHAHAAGRAEKGTVADEEDSDDDMLKNSALSLAERQDKARREREEKQRKYQEAREKLFGPNKPNSVLPESGDGSVRNKSISQRSSMRAVLGNPEGSQMNKMNVDDRQVRVGPSISRGTKSIEKPIRMPKGPEKVGRNGAGFVLKGIRGNEN